MSNELSLQQKGEKKGKIRKVATRAPVADVPAPSKGAVRGGLLLGSDEWVFQA